MDVLHVAVRFIALVDDVQSTIYDVVDNNSPEYRGQMLAVPSVLDFLHQNKWLSHSKVCMLLDRVATYVGQISQTAPLNRNEIMTLLQVHADVNHHNARLFENVCSRVLKLAAADALRPQDIGRVALRSSEVGHSSDVSYSNLIAATSLLLMNYELSAGTISNLLWGIATAGKIHLVPHDLHEKLNQRVLDMSAEERVSDVALYYLAMTSAALENSTKAVDVLDVVSQRINLNSLSSPQLLGLLAAYTHAGVRPTTARTVVSDAARLAVARTRRIVDATKRAALMRRLRGLLHDCASSDVLTEGESDNLYISLLADLKAIELQMEGALESDDPSVV
eukprot:GFYU01048236.1.p1 GENE.GFYU01048236.1~~GFYU01048236.1.p1  ORF type:complete len:336 (+),score=62.76 GFYU01048236.1:910-1917(+)